MRRNATCLAARHRLSFIDTLRWEQALCLAAALIVLPPMATPTRTLKVRCPTWDHVEAFYTRKLQDRNVLSIRVPFQPECGVAITVALELPNADVLAIDGAVTSARAATGGGRATVAIELLDFDALRSRLTELVSQARASAVRQPSTSPVRQPPVEPPPPEPSDAPVDEPLAPPWVPTLADVPIAQRGVFAALESTLVAMREAAAHEVLEVVWDAGVDEVRRAYLAMSRRYHPDVLGRYRSAAIRHLAQEVFIYVNRAYDRMRDAAVARGCAIAAGPALLPHDGWLAGWGDLDSDIAGQRPSAAERSSELDVQSLTARARQSFDSGDYAAAQEALAAALHADPRDRSLRALYHASVGYAALASGNTARASTQLEAAVAHDGGCEPALQGLERLRREHPHRRRREQGDS